MTTLVKSPEIFRKFSLSMENFRGGGRGSLSERAAVGLAGGTPSLVLPTRENAVSGTLVEGQHILRRMLTYAHVC